jgi:hypothetical protein
MAEMNLKIWFDAEGDYLEVIFNKKHGYFRETLSDQVMEKVDEQEFPGDESLQRVHLAARTLTQNDRLLDEAGL